MQISFPWNIKEANLSYNKNKTVAFRPGVSNSNYRGAEERPVWSVGGQIFLIGWHNTVDATFKCGKFTMCDQWYNG